jgi:predicted XRE-type DNA-binding protein
MTDQNLFTLFEEDQTVAEIKNIKTKLLMLAIQNIRNNGWTQAQVAEKAEITQPRVSNLMQGQLTKFSVDALINVNLKLGAKLNVAFNPIGEFDINMSV